MCGSSLGMKKRLFVGFIHILVLAHMIWMLSKDNSSHIEGVLFVAYVLVGAFYWKKVAKEKKKQYD